MRTRLSNYQDDQATFREDIEVEEGGLSKAIRRTAVYRCMTFNDANVRLNTVTGSASGTAGAVIACKDSNLLSFQLGDGRCLTSSAITPSDRSLLDFGFHSKPVTCLSYSGSTVVSGSMDHTVRVWDADDFVSEVLPYKKFQEIDAAGDGKPKPPQPPRSKLTFTVHSATVTAVKLTKGFVVSGGSDLLLLFWCVNTGTVFRQVKGFETSVLSLHVTDNAVSCGCTDGLARLWTYEPTTKNPIAGLKPLHSVNGTAADGSVSAVFHNALELLCGHRKGTIAAWNMLSGDLIFSVPAHTDTVTCLQSDTSKVVSCGFDGYIKVRGGAGPRVRLMSLCNLCVCVCNLCVCVCVPGHGLGDRPRPSVHPSAGARARHSVRLHETGGGHAHGQTAQL